MSLPCIMYPPKLFTPKSKGSNLFNCARKFFPQPLTLQLILHYNYIAELELKIITRYVDPTACNKITSDYGIPKEETEINK